MAWRGGQVEVPGVACARAESGKTNKDQLETKHIYEKKLYFEMLLHDLCHADAMCHTYGLRKV